MQTEEDLKNVVRAYISLLDEVDKMGKTMKELRKQQKDMGESILKFMTQHDIDECELAEGGTLARQSKKRQESLKKDHILSELVNVVGSEDRAASCLDNILNSRGQEVKESLKRTRNKSKTTE